MFDSICGKVYPITGYEQPEGRTELQLYYSFNLGAREGYMINAMHRLLYPAKENCFSL
jgi:hypothetical protein